jgi:hypothetical protein
MKQGLIIDENGHKEWWLNGERHRVGGPAIECSNGDKEWWLNGELHRVDGPAIEWVDGSKSWFITDQLVYSKNVNKLSQYDNLSETFKKSIIKYKLSN